MPSQRVTLLGIFSFLGHTRGKVVVSRVLMQAHISRESKDQISLPSYCEGDQWVVLKISIGCLTNGHWRDAWVSREGRSEQIFVAYTRT